MFFHPQNLYIFFQTFNKNNKHNKNCNSTKVFVLLGFLRFSKKKAEFIFYIYIWLHLWGK